ncbi:MAG TPA: ribosome-associated translation inhibitor RaiA [Mycobacteriales bacterium]|nr:ribosome-associated translation inhibitor RaiA [Mycobacteriales bacterium]
MDIVVKGRNVEVPEHFRVHVQEKLALCERLDPRVYHVDVELFHEKNPRQAAQCQRIEITVRGKGPVIRAEATADTFYAALDAAILKLEGRLRRSHDRRRVHHGARTPVSAAEFAVALAGSRNGSSAEAAHEENEGELDETGALIVRDKTHPATPMTTPEALHEMELVGHDFFLFSDKESGLPSVVYRRHGYDYGVIRLAIG